MKVFLQPSASKQLKKLDLGLRKRIKGKLKELGQGICRGEMLVPSEFWKLRVGDYRIVYEILIEEGKVLVLFIGHRKKVYDDFNKLF